MTLKMTSADNPYRLMANTTGVAINLPHASDVSRWIPGMLDPFAHQTLDAARIISGF